MNTTDPRSLLHAYALRDAVKAALYARCPDLVDALDMLHGFTGTMAERDACDAAVKALAADDVQPQDVDLALWREYAATDLNADDTVAPWDFDDGSMYEADEGDEPRWMYE